LEKESTKQSKDITEICSSLTFSCCWPEACNLQRIVTKGNKRLAWFSLQAAFYRSTFYDITPRPLRCLVGLLCVQ